MSGYTCQKIMFNVQNNKVFYSGQWFCLPKGYQVTRTIYSIVENVHPDNRLKCPDNVIFPNGQFFSGLWFDSRLFGLETGSGKDWQKNVYLDRYKQC